MKMKMKMEEEGGKKKEENKKLKKKFIKTQNVHMYVLLTQTRTVTFYKIEPSSRQGERPTSNKTATLLTTTTICS
jgi:hypothetical protein